MESDPLSTLLRQHFQKVIEYIQNGKNFDVLTRFSFISTPNENLDSAADQTDFNYVDHELELENMKISNTNFDAIEMRKTSSGSLVDDDDSEVFQKEIDLDVEPEYGRLSPTQDILVGSISPIEKTTSETQRKLFIERPDTPLLQFSDFDDENSSSISPVQKTLQRSEKFMCLKQFEHQNNVEYPRDLNEPSTSQTDESEQRFSILQSPKSERSSQLTIERDSNDFEWELEKYKKDIKIERAIKNNSQSFTVQNKILESSFELIFENQLINNCGTTMPSSKRDSFTTSESIEKGMPEITEMDFNIKKIVSMNHLEIHKQMSRKIEDMYKSGDGN